MYSVSLLCIVTLCILHIVYCTLIIYITRVNTKNVIEVKPPRAAQIKVSLIIIARNEAHNLHQLFTSLIAQNYTAKNIEIIFVDDNSTDETLAIAQIYINQLLINYIELSKYTHIASNYKKQAQALAVTHCTNDFVICIDADVQLPPNFIAAHVQHYTTNDHYFQYGLVTFENTNKNLIQRTDYNENLALQALTRAAALTNNHMLCNGANMAFSKQAYTALQAKSTSSNASGDDVLLLQKFINAGYTASYVNTVHAQVQHATTTSAPLYLQQRARWFSKQGSYTNAKLNYTMYCIGLQNLVQLLLQVGILIVGGMLMFTASSTYCLLMLLLVLVVTKLVVDITLVRRFEQIIVTTTTTKLTLSVIGAALAYSWYVWAVVLYTKFSLLRWKERVIK